MFDIIFEGIIINYFRNKPLEDIYHVKLGVNNICDDEKTQEIFTTKKVIIHEDYREQMPFADIAILELDRDAVNFTPVCLPNKSRFCHQCTIDPTSDTTI